LGGGGGGGGVGLPPEEKSVGGLFLNCQAERRKSVRVLVHPKKRRPPASRAATEGGKTAVGALSEQERKGCL